MSTRIIRGECRAAMRDLIAAGTKVQTCVTSPPYWGLRDYGHAGQLGLEPSPQEYVANMVEVFGLVKDLLADDGTLWLNIGDSYNAHPGQRKIDDKVGSKQASNAGSNTVGSRSTDTLKVKDLVGIPWRVAFALQADGWYLRQDIIWHKPNPMPESVTDRCTKSHEYIFLLTKSERSHYDADAIAEPAQADHPSGNRTHKGATQYALDEGEFHRTKAGLVGYAERQRDSWRGSSFGKGKTAVHQEGRAQPDEARREHEQATRNKRSVWTVSTKPFSEAHFATFPPDLIEPCILAGCPEGGMVLDPFGGAGTTGLVADRHGRNAILIELNDEYATMAERRITNDSPLFSEVTA